MSEERVPKESTSDLFIKPSPGLGARAPSGRICTPTDCGKKRKSIFPPDCPEARTAGPAGAWTGRKGFRLHADTPKRVQTTQTN